MISILPASLTTEREYLNDVLIRLFVVAHHSRLPRYQWSWIDICRRMNVDPGQLTTDHISDFKDILAQNMWPAEKDPEFQNAAFSACGTLAFISPETAIPFLVTLISESLPPEVYTWIAHTDITIWRGTEGTPVIDVLAKPTNGVPARVGKPAKKGDWEAELRAELEKKKGTPAKLSAKDQALVNEQVAKESGIRKRVEEARQIVRTDRKSVV